jgi:hypothetical protein
VNRRATIAPPAVPVMSALARWSAPPVVCEAGRYSCHDLGYAGLHHWSAAPSVPIGCRYFCDDRGYDRDELPLPKWESSAVRFAPRVLPEMSRPRRHRLRIQCTVSSVSVVRSRVRADRAVPAPVKIDAIWTKPAEKPVAFEDLFIWFAYDHDLSDEDRLDKTEIPKELRGVRSIPSRQRAYSAEERYIVKVGDEGQFSNVKRVELEFPGAETRDERHELDLWPFFPDQVGESKYDLKVRPLTLQELKSGWATVTTLANQLSRAANQEVRKIIGAKTASGRTFQTSEIILRLYRFGTRDRVIPEGLLLAARAVYQTVCIELLLRDLEKRIALGEKGRLSTAPDLRRVVEFMLAPGNSSYDAAIKFDRRDASNFRDQLNDALDIIEAKYGVFCRDLGLTPQTRVRACDNSNKNRDSAALRALEHEAEAARYRRAEATKYLKWEKWLRDAYRALAEHFERGGHIFYGPTAYGTAPGLYDGRSDKQVLREAGLVEPEERFPPAKAKRPRPNKEYGIDVGLRHGLNDTIAGTDDDDTPIRDTREPASAALMREASPFLSDIRTISPYDEE